MNRGPILMSGLDCFFNDKNYTTKYKRNFGMYCNIIHFMETPLRNL